MVLCGFVTAAHAAQPADLRPVTAPAGPLFRLDEYRGGKPLALQDQRGKIVLLHFFATYCEPCRPEMASLNLFLKANADKPFAVFAVDVGEIDLRVRAFFEKDPVDFPIVLDRDRKISRAWGVYALPTTIVLDEKLQPKLIVEGDLDWSHPDVLKKLETLLPARSNPVPRTGGLKNKREERTMDRRQFLKGTAAVSLAATLPSAAWAAYNLTPGKWNTFDVTTRIEIAKPGKGMQAWVPLPSINNAEWFRVIGNTWKSNGRTLKRTEPKYRADMVHIAWADNQTAPFVEVVSRVAMRDRQIDPTKKRAAAALNANERKLYLTGTDLIPVTGIVKETSDKITKGAKTDIEKVQLIYNWVVENSARNPKTRGCGIGDIAAMLKTGDLTGKCADLNALFVGLTRAAGVPARDVYGLRVAPSKFGYKSLGAGSANVTRAQHCRAEAYIANVGWIPVDPADVRKVVLEEPPGNLAINDPKVVAARAALLGSWEGNWLAYNFAHDVQLPGTNQPKLGFLMYPQAQVASLLLDCLEPDQMKYTITSKELPSA